MEPIAPLHLARKPKMLHSVSMKNSRIANLQVLSAIAGCALAGLIISFASAATAQLVLQEGDSGTAVNTLQDRLRTLGCYDGETTGFFGSQTRDAVIRCQEQRGIRPDGIVGAETYRALGLGNPEPGTGSNQYGDRLQLGDRGAGVEELQRRLQTRGYYYGEIDGVFGQETQNAVIQLQRDAGLSQTGVMDAQAYAALDGSTSPTPDVGNGLQLGDQNSRVADLQQQLNRIGYLLPVTGYFGTQTQQAVLSFQQSRSLPATGNADPETLRAIQQATGGSSTPSNSRRYSVVIPFTDSASFNRIQSVVPDAVPRQNRLGNFVRAGSFTTPEEAERQANRLRARGLTDARVVFE